MTWELSRYRAGDLVEVRSKEEILATLDERGCIDGLPFMPEMLKFCGQRIQVRAVAHKTCDVALQTLKARRIQTTVHLSNLRCDGAAHGGCQAGCTLFWKDTWLKPTKDGTSAELRGGAAKQITSSCTEERLMAHTLSRSDVEGKEPVYACQATMLFDATVPLGWWDEHVRQYMFDVVSRNHSVARVIRVTLLSALRKLNKWTSEVRVLRSVIWAFCQWMHRQLTGREVPSLFTAVKPLEKTPTGRLNLKTGDWVRIKSKLEIEKTLGEGGKNRGLTFDPEEMAPYCGGKYRVQSSVTRIVDEATGKMRLMKEPCIILDGVVCNAEYASCRLNCPRAIYSYWRELWLEQVEA